MSKEEQLLDAAGDGDLSVVKQLAADTTLDVNRQVPEGGYTPFNYACQEGRVSVVEFLLTLTTINENKPANNGATPFYVACYEGHEEVVSLLLNDTRIDMNQPQNDGGSPFFVACYKVTKKWYHCSSLTQ